MNKEFVYQIGNNKKVILWCTANQISRFTYCVCRYCSVPWWRKKRLRLEIRGFHNRVPEDLILREIPLYFWVYSFRVLGVSSHSYSSSLFDPKCEAPESFETSTNVSKSTTQGPKDMKFRSMWCLARVSLSLSLSLTLQTKDKWRPADKPGC
jgi:hypothetical protein